MTGGTSIPALAINVRSLMPALHLTPVREDALASLFFEPEPLWNPNATPTEHTRLAAAEVQPAAQANAEGRPAKHRSWVSTMAIQTALVGGTLRAGLDMARLFKKYPEAIRGGRLGTAIFQTLRNAPDIRIIDPRAPRIATAASGWRSFTRFDQVAYRASMLAGSALAGLQFASSIPNLIEAVSTNGPEGLVNTKSGRSGTLNFIGGGFGLLMFRSAVQDAVKGGTKGIGNIVLAASNSYRLTTPTVATIAVVSGALMVANELGFFDFLDEGETRDLGTIASDAFHNLPFL